MGRPTGSQGPRGRPSKSRSGGQEAYRSRGPIGSMATFGGSSDHLYSSRGDLEGPIGSRMMLRGPKWGDRGREGPRGMSGGIGSV